MSLCEPAMDMGLSPCRQKTQNAAIQPVSCLVLTMRADEVSDDALPGGPASGGDPLHERPGMLQSRQRCEPLPALQHAGALTERVAARGQHAGKASSDTSSAHAGAMQETGW